MGSLVRRSTVSVLTACRVVVCVSTVGIHSVFPSVALHNYVQPRYTYAMFRDFCEAIELLVAPTFSEPSSCSWPSRSMYRIHAVWGIDKRSQPKKRTIRVLKPPYKVDLQLSRKRSRVELHEFHCRCMYILTF